MSRQHEFPCPFTTASGLVGAAGTTGAFAVFNAHEGLEIYDSAEELTKAHPGELTWTQPKTETCFVLQRHQDITGVSGTGAVGEGYRHTNGKVVVFWRGERPTVTRHKEMEWVHFIHAHLGKTEIIWQQ